MTRRKSSLSLWGALFILEILLVAVAVVLIASIGVREYRQDLRLAEQGTHAIAEAIASEFRVLVISAEELGETLSMLPEVQGRDPAKIEPLLAKLIAQSPVYANIVLLDRDGRAWASGVPMQGKSYSMADRRYFRSAMATGKFSAGEYTKGKTTGKPVLTFGYPLRDASGTLWGCIALGFNLEYFTTVFQASGRQATASFSFIDHGGTILYRSRSTADYIGKAFPSDRLEAMRAGAKSATDIGPGLDGERKVRSYVKLSLREGVPPYLYVQATESFDRIAAGIRAAVARDIAILTALVLPLLSLTWYVGRRFVVTPVRLLTDAIERVAEGDLGVRIVGEVHLRELEKTASSFNKMVASLAANIAERERAEKARLESAEQHRIIVQTAMDGVCLTDGEGRILEVNEAYCRMVGYDEAELLRMFVSDLEAVEAAPETAEHIRKLMSEGHDRFESRHRRKDGSLLDVEVSVGYRGASGGYIVAFIRDITERKRVERDKARLEAQLLQSQKMEAIGTLAGGIAHDFNNILTPVMAHAELALLQLGADDPVREDVTQLLVAAERAASLVRQILVISRKEADAPLVPIPLGPLVKEVSKFLRASLPAMIEIRAEVDPACGPVMGDMAQLHQVLLNLCTNAGHAMQEKGGVLTVSLEPVGCERPGRRVKLSVRDTGPGIPKAIQGRIFEPYFTTKPVGKGSGLGLSVVHGVVTKLGGDVRVVSEAGQGTTFEVLLPVAEVAEAPHHEPGRQKELGGEGKSVLIVDDEDAIRKVVGKMLCTLGYRVTEHSGGAEALAALRDASHTYDAVVTDYAMPGMTGLALADQMLQLRPDLPIILATGFSEHVDAGIVSAHGLRSLIMKPYTVQKLGEVLQAAIEGASRG